VEPGWVPPEIDITKANIARVYDYWLGGSHNFRADQDVARAMIAVDPNIRAMMRANRAFLGRAVRYLAREGGIRQFLDIGSGIPTEQNVHEVAQAAAPGTRIVYVDNDEVAVAHSRLMLEDNPDATVIQADLREPDKILADPETQLLIDFTQPVALLLLAVLHFVPDMANPAQILATLRDAVPPGSYLVICHACRDVQARHGGQRDRRVQQPGRGELAGADPRRDRGPVRRLHPGGAWPGMDTRMAARLTRRCAGEPGAILGPGRRGQARRLTAWVRYLAEVGREGETTLGRRATAGQVGDDLPGQRRELGAVS
jgi:hypothetical protein